MEPEAAGRVGAPGTPGAGGTSESPGGSSKQSLAWSITSSPSSDGGPFFSALSFSVPGGIGR